MRDRGKSDRAEGKRKRMGQKDRFRDRFKEAKEQKSTKGVSETGPRDEAKGAREPKGKTPREGSEGRREPREGAIPRKVCSLLRRGRMALSRARPAIMEGRTPTVTSAVSRPGLSPYALLQHHYAGNVPMLPSTRIAFSSLFHLFNCSVCFPLFVFSSNFIGAFLRFHVQLCLFL